jgi:octaprenyl-diphosphate synthase
LFLLKENFKRELEEIESTLVREIKFKSADLDELVKLEFGELDYNACALIVLSINQAFGGLAQPAIGLATVVQYIFMADQVHRLMKDDSDLEENKRQFPVLVGDLLYGKFFLSLCKEKLLHFLAPLAQVIGIMNQGAISRFLSNGKKVSETEALHILEMERASLTGLAARLGADLAGCSDKVQQQCEVFGWHLGIAWAASQDSMASSIAQKALTHARDVLKDWPGSKEHALYELVDYIEGNLGGVS